MILLVGSATATGVVCSLPHSASPSKHAAGLMQSCLVGIAQAHRQVSQLLLNELRLKD